MQRTRLSSINLNEEKPQGNPDKDNNPGAEANPTEVKKDKENEKEEGKGDKDQEKLKEAQREKELENDLLVIPGLVSIDKPRRPEISSQRKQDLKEKLELEKESMIKVREREKINDLIFSFDRNVFREVQLKEEDEPVKPIREGERTTVHQLHKLTQAPIFQEYEESRKRFREEMSENVRVFDKLKSTFWNKREFKLREDSSPEQKPKEKQGQKSKGEGASKKEKEKDKDKEENSEGKEEKKVGEETKPAKKEKEENHWLDSLPKTAMDIFKMEEENIYLKKDKGLNIFREAKISTQKDYVKENFLEETNFIEKSVADSFNITSIKIDSFKHISKFARLLAANKEESIKKGSNLEKTKETPEDYLNEYDMSYQLNNLDYRTLMNIASGRFTSLFFAKNLLEIEDVIIEKKDEKKEYSLSEKSEREMDIPPRQGYSDQKHQIELNNMDDFYRECMIKAPLLQEEERTKKQYKKLYKEIEKQLRRKELQLMSRIDDKEEKIEETQITIQKLNHFRGQKHSYKQIKKIFEENKKEKTKKDQFWLENFNKVLELQIKSHDSMQRMRKDSIFYEEPDPKQLSFRPCSFGQQLGCPFLDHLGFYVLGAGEELAEVHFVLLLVLQGLLHHLVLVDVLHDHALEFGLLLVPPPNVEKVLLCLVVQGAEDLLHGLELLLLLLLLPYLTLIYVILSKGVQSPVSPSARS